ncbi:MAG: hypothetical protein DRQ62_00135 [Gammaproteobacteria bacterium]|nr:MAG: hypothetical protein DRQ62_00135 [Gammaproteobacteria bacterium]
MLAIIDGDILAHNACRPRWRDKAKIVNGVNYVSLDDDGNKQELEFDKEEDTQYLLDSWENFKDDLDKMLDRLYIDKYIMAVKSPTNFRDDMYPDYKMNRRKQQMRKPRKQNMFVPSIRKLAVTQGYAVYAHDREADDYVRIWAEEARRVGEDFIVCSVDKDLQCIPGKHWLMHHEKILNITEDGARTHYYQQLLKGDPTDNIPGLPGIGPVAARDLVWDCRNDGDFQEVVVECYVAQYEGEWKQWLLSNGKMIHIQRDMDDYFTLEDWPFAKEIESL